MSMIIQAISLFAFLKLMIFLFRVNRLNFR